MKRVTVFSIVIAVIIFICNRAIADDAEFRTTVSRNDKFVGGEFHLDLEIQITSGTTPRTLSSFTVDIYYGSELAAWSSNPAMGWVFGLADGYTMSADKMFGYYRIMVTGGGVNVMGELTPPGDPPGWDATTSWKKIVTLRWTIATATSVNISIDDGTDAAGYFDNYTNAPQGSATDWTVTNQDLGDVSLPVQMTNISAIASRDEGVILTWGTESEVNSTGFHVWRSESREGPYEQVTTSLISGQGNSSTAFEYTFIDRNVQDGIVYWYKIEEVSTAGESQFYGPVSVMGIDMVPTEFGLSQNYPNPFNPETKFEYQLPEDCDVWIQVYSLLGQKVKELVNGKQSAGYYTVNWGGTDDLGRKVPSGIYLLHIRAGNFSEMRKMTIMR